MNRKEFLELSKAVIGGLAMNGVFAHLANAQSPADNEPLEGRDEDDFYLAKGLTGMARGGGWFDAHWGAAVLAGYYLCKDNHLGDETTAAIKKQLDSMILLRAPQFESFPEEAPDEASIDEVTKAVVPAMQDGLRAHGHAVIFASLSTRALRDAPHMAQPKLIDGLCGLSRQIAKINPQKPAGPASYANMQSMVEATFNSLARFEPLLGRPSVRRPNFTHMITHTEALLNLHAMGYRDLVLTGHAGHKAHIAAPVPSFEPDQHPKVDHRFTLDRLISQDFFANEKNLSRWNKAWNESSNPNGYWVAFGHLFKVLYSYHRLIDRIADADKLSLCSMILLERYVNPDVKGG